MWHNRLEEAKVQVTVEHLMYSLCLHVCVFVPPADRQRQTEQHQWSGGDVCPEGRATGLSEAPRASQLDSCRLCARAEGT